MDARERLMMEVWGRGCSYSHIASWASHFGVTDLPTKEEFKEFSRKEHERMLKFMNDEQGEN